MKTVKNKVTILNDGRVEIIFWKLLNYLELLKNGLKNLGKKEKATQKA